ncbi:MAG: Sec-independent protein translocase protein TatB [Candidatus Puniceispirillaceae bacterium]
MLDIGGWEFLLVAFVLVMVVGPKELPAMLRSFTKLTRQMRSVAREFTDGMNQIAVDAEVAEVKNAISKARSGDLDAVASAIDPDGDLGASVKEARDAMHGNDMAGAVDEIADLARNSGREIAASADNDIAPSNASAAPAKAVTAKTSTKAKSRAAKKKAGVKPATKTAAKRKKHKAGPS